MNPISVLTLLGVWTLLPCVPALTCRRSRIQTVRSVVELPLEWEMDETTCEAGEGCQDLVMLLYNGPQINLVVIKDCVKVEDQEPRVTWLRTGPGLSVVSYIHVCRHGDLCNDAHSTKILGDLPTPTVPGSLRCPLCLSKDGCENAPEQVCPAGSTHCYNGVLRLRGEIIKTNLKVQGCMPQPDCNLLNGTKVIGTLYMNEYCGLQLGSQALDCNSGELDTVNNVSDLHLSWTTGWKTCEAGEACYETVMLTQNGLGNLSCPFCLSKDGCPQNGPERVCPAGSTHCYSGILSLHGGGIISNLKVQGCAFQSQSDCNLLNGTQTIGPINVREGCGLQLAAEVLKCQHGTLETVQDKSNLPLQWTAGQKTCDVGEGCQDTLMMIENAPGNMSCPLCFSAQACESAPEQVCPAGSTHCYSGVLSLHGGGIISNQKVQGCMSQPGCNLLNGIQKIGPMDVSEHCSPLSNTLTCYRGIMFKLGYGLAEEAVKWTVPGTQACELDEICQETLLLIDVGQKSALLGSKGCSKPGAQNNVGVSIFSRPPGMLMVSYTRFCSSRLCNGANSSSVLLSILPHPDVPPPGDVQCPMCVQLFGSCQNTKLFTCPQGATHCYKGDIELRGGGLSSTVGIQGCMAPPIKPLLGGSKTIGIFSAKEISGYQRDDENNGDSLLDGASTSSLAWMLGLSALLSSLCAGICPLC
ncbi:CD177 antigen-like isoform X2 [Mastomys coucha]|uniref:CD177 antigen-like isoform X2 n=1 Tax=Mastomys coucha TaxID=35658 RepID=UPI001261F2B9|nr:CD177 antigen-like isoform X2 [Mastomys coucha]